MEKFMAEILERDEHAQKAAWLVQAILEAGSLRPTRGSWSSSSTGSGWGSGNFWGSSGWPWTGSGPSSQAVSYLLSKGQRECFW